MADLSKGIDIHVTPGQDSDPGNAGIINSESLPGLRRDLESSEKNRSMSNLCLFRLLS